MKIIGKWGQQILNYEIKINIYYFTWTWGKIKDFLDSLKLGEMICMLNDMGEMGELPLDDQAAAEKGN